MGFVKIIRIYINTLIAVNQSMCFYPAETHVIVLIKRVSGGDVQKDLSRRDHQGIQRALVPGLGRYPEEQRVKFSHIAQHVVNDTNYETQVVNIPDKQNIQLPLFSKNLTTMAVQKPST